MNLDSENFEVIQALTSVDWHFEFKSGRAWREGRNKYDTAMKLLRELPENVAHDLFEQYCKAPYTPKAGGYKNPFKAKSFVDPCCDNEQRTWDGGCKSCGDPCY